MTNLVLWGVWCDGRDPSRLSLFDGEEHGFEVGARVVAVEKDAVSLLPHTALTDTDPTSRLHAHNRHNGPIVERNRVFCVGEVNEIPPSYTMWGGGVGFPLCRLELS